jgi:rhodanese-related sulfurtransferase
MKTISPAELASALTQSVAPQFVDVRLADDFEAAHLPGALNNSVFEVAFHDRLANTLADKDHAIVIYGATAKSHEAAMAVEKLERAGYSDLLILDGGIDAWITTGHAIETGTPLPPVPPSPDGDHELDLAECRLEWLGRNLLNKHQGTIAITEGHLKFDQGQLCGGEVVFDLTTLQCTDLDGALHDVLIGHLKDHDFLDATEHPECRLVIRSADPITGAASGCPNLTVHADLTMRGVTQPIDFTAAAGLTPEGKPAAQTSFAIDRTRWGILYGSSRFFHRLSGHLVNDLIEFQARILTK